MVVSMRCQVIEVFGMSGFPALCEQLEVLEDIVLSMEANPAPVKFVSITASSFYRYITEGWLT